jgi:hypothetical protein
LVLDHLIGKIETLSSQFSAAVILHVIELGK